MFKLPVEKLSALFAAVAGKEALYIPADDAAGQANFTLWREGLQLTKKLNTVRSAKDLFFPQVEDMLSGDLPVAKVRPQDERYGNKLSFWERLER